MRSFFWAQEEPELSLLRQHPGYCYPLVPQREKACICHHLAKGFQSQGTGLWVGLV